MVLTLKILNEFFEEGVLLRSRYSVFDTDKVDDKIGVGIITTCVKYTSSYKQTTYLLTYSGSGVR